MAELITTALYSDGALQEYYQLEGLTGKNGNTLANTNSVAFNSAKFGNGADGGASNTNKTLSVASALGYANANYSIFGWVKLNAEIASGEWCFLNVVETTTDTSISINYEYNGGTIRLVFHRIKHGVADTTFTSNQVLGTSLLHHIGFTYDGTTLTGYLDNVSLGTLSSNGNGVTNVASIFTLLADRSNTLNASAIMDDVGLFNKVLSAGEISTLYTDTVASGETGYSFFM